MLLFYLKSSFRSLLKTPLFTALNTAGLAIGLTVALLLFLYVQHESSFDRFHSKAAQVYRVLLQITSDESKPSTLANAPIAVGPAAKNDIGDVEQYLRLLKHGFGKPAFVSIGNQQFVEEHLYWTEATLPQLFDIQVLAGNLPEALSQPNVLAISRSAAMRFFGIPYPIGQVVRVDHMPPMEVRAVFEDFPENSTLEANMLGSLASVDDSYKNNLWSNASFETWLLLRPGASPQAVTAQLAATYDRNVPKPDQYFTMSLQALPDVHLYSLELRNHYSTRLGDPKMVNLLSVLAVAILLIACFNYMNLATARSQLRFREVGIAKTLGATRAQLALRFYLETAVLVVGALALALLLVQSSLPLFNRLADKQLQAQMLFQPAVLGAVGGIALAVTLVSASYPAFLMSGFLPKKLLQTSFRSETSAGWLRRSLVTAQFTASVALLIGTVVLYRQMQFIQQKNLGFVPEQVLAVNTSAADSDAQVDALKQKCLAMSNVVSACRAQTFPGGRPSGRAIYRNEQEETGLLMWTNHVSAGFEQVLGVKLLAGSLLPPAHPGDTVVHVTLNKTAVSYLGLTPENAIGQKVLCQLGPNAVITGVLEDFHAESLHRPIEAYAFHDRPTEDMGFLMLKIKAGNIPEAMQQIQTAFSETIPQSAFRYEFLDEHLDALYRREHRTAKVVLVFSLLSVFVACLGLFGLVTFSAEQRKKEIGIRRVLGARIAGIAVLLAGDLLRLVLVSLFVATPLAWWVLNRWLDNFAYRVDLQAWMFVVAGLAALLVAVLTVGVQGVRAALANPVETLRNE